jgi:hypothetical protein
MVEMEEVWKDIIGFPTYQVSNLGNVKSLRRNIILKPRPVKKKYGYICYDVNLYGAGPAHQKIHRLVAQAFIPNPDNKIEIDHIDRDPSNNRVDNLRWATRSENVLNTKVRSDNTSGSKGVYWNKSRERFQVKVFKDNKEIYIGAYKTLEEAITARNDYLKSNI